MRKLFLQNGRSMVEMLGVLAIVGVLSILGIAGYKKAMSKIHANELMDLAMKVYNEAIKSEEIICQKSNRQRWKAKQASRL